MNSLDAVVIAGGHPAPGDVLYDLTQGRPKVLLDLAGRPMLQWVLDALGAAPSVRRVVVVGLEPSAPLTCARPLAFLPDSGDILENASAGVRWVLQQDASARQALIVSGDIPLVTPAAVEWVAAAAQAIDAELYYTVIPREVMEQRFPGARRTYVPVKGGVFSGGDLHAVDTGVLTHLPPAMRAILAARKNVLRQASLVGFDVLIKLALRQADVAYVERMCRERLGLRGRALFCPHAEVGMDVDKPWQYELARLELAARR